MGTRFLAGRIFRALFPGFERRRNGELAVEAMRKRRIVHGASLNWLLIFCKGLSSEPSFRQASIQKQRTLARRQKTAGDARLFEKGKRAGGCRRRHSQKSDEVDGMVDVHSDSRLANDERVDPAASRRIEMRVKTVFAEPQRNGVRRGADDGIRSAIVMRGHDSERRRGPVTTDIVAERGDEGGLGSSS
jgi:hypothetical protein